MACACAAAGLGTAGGGSALGGGVRGQGLAARGAAAGQGPAGILRIGTLRVGHAEDGRMALRGGSDVDMDLDAQERIEKEKKHQKKKRAEKKKWKKIDEEKAVKEEVKKSEPQIIHGPDGVIYALDPDFPHEVNFVPTPIPDMDDEGLEMRVLNSTNLLERDGGQEEVNPYTYYTRKPRAEPELEKRLFDLVSECDKAKQTKKGANEVTKAINRNTAEFIVLACDTTPIEIVLHLPLICEDKGVPFVWVSTREELGKACGVTRQVTAVAVLANERSHLTGRVRKMRIEIDNMPY